MVKQARAQVTRDTIVEGAASVFGRRGYGLTSIADIATASGVTKGALYFHFPSKDELARAVIAEQHRRTMAAAAEVLEEERPGLETMVLLSGVLAHQLLTDPVVQAGIRLTTDIAFFETPATDPYRDWQRLAETLFGRGVEEGDLRPGLDPAMLASVVVASYTGVQLVSETFSGRADLLQRVRELWTVLLPGIVAADRASALTALPELIR
ncbi:ScbR family autoregulator-binding transcription factor [Leifsonia shinshuensis]|uniref:ScbR family autoregulator-binding transcription factor n=1 Tax=Leifsonia shinshuensis TaxID=150026 RepID=UPI002866DB7A|nr:ScbR family autoregulator-binding transcription factor [Leifsonia shinshuensis]MDR6971546.1 AcrR family transcriptional regulator [Leifsonia shinshuensis]